MECPGTQSRSHVPLAPFVPSNRSEAIRLGKLLDTLLEAETGGWEDQCDAYDSTFAEAALQVANHCAERGELLQRIRPSELLRALRMSFGLEQPLFWSFFLYFHLWSSFPNLPDQNIGFYTPKLPPGANSEVWKPDFS